MGLLIARRLLSALLTVLVLLTFVFLIVRATGNPVSYLLPFDFTTQQEQAVRRELGLDRPLIVQYGVFLGNALHGDFGYSHRWKRDAMGMVMERLPRTLGLAVLAFAISLTVSIPLGVIAAAKRGAAVDTVIRIATTTGQAVPNFVLAILLIWLLSVKLRWLPIGGAGGLNHYILPAVSLAWFSIAAQTRLVRSAVGEVLVQDYVRTARAKGLGHAAVLMRHGLRSALVPILTMIGLQWAYFLGGTVVIETVFSWPGVGRLMIDAVLARDFAVIQSGTIVLSVLFITINLVTDLSYLIADPRTRRTTVTSG